MHCWPAASTVIDSHHDDMDVHSTTELTTVVTITNVSCAAQLCAHGAMCVQCNVSAMCLQCVCSDKLGPDINKRAGVLYLQNVCNCLWYAAHEPLNVMLVMLT